MRLEKGLSLLIKCTIVKIEIHNFKLRYPIPKNISKIHKGAIIINFKRVGKYILINLNNNFLVYKNF